MDAISLHDYVFEQLLDKHKPVFTQDDELWMREHFTSIAVQRVSGEDWTTINLTQLGRRTCSCDIMLNSFDEYRNHLIDVMMEAQAT